MSGGSIALNEGRDLASSIGASQGGDREALGRLLERERTLLRRVVVSFGGSAVRSRIDDAVQEASLEAIRAIGQLREPDRFRSWLVGIAVRVAKRHRRAFARDRLVPVGAGDEAGEPRATDDDPADVAERTIDGERPRRVEDCPPERLALEVERAAAELPESWREVFALRHGAGLRYREIASALELTESAVESRLIRARRRIRTMVEGRLARGESIPETESSDR